MTDNRTTELREKLDALNIEHFDYDKGGRTQTQWEAPDGKRHFTYETSNNSAKTARLVIAWHPTPEQAIAATLGNAERTCNITHDFKCSNCGNQIGAVRNCEVYETEDGRQAWRSLDREVCDVPNYCPHCASKVVD